jgi:hypothetical protein
MANLVTIVEEPTGEAYSGLLRFALRTKSLFSLVWCEQFEFDREAISLAEALRPDFVSERRTDEWPGTQLFGHFAVVRMYRMSTAALATLAEVGRLYGWSAPERPEDLAFYVGENNPWLGSIAHEQDAFIYPDAIDIREVCTNVPGLRLEHVAGR